MNKIVQVINAMISKQKNISNVRKNDREYFFLYNDKHKWSISRDDNSEDYYIHFYPTDAMDINQLSTFTEWNQFNDFTTYATNDIKTQESLESFRELYQLVSNKIFGIDDIFDEIITE